MSAHAKLSPSGAHRWMACPGSVVLEAEFPDTSSVYADEGTAAHTLAGWCLDGKLDADGYRGGEIKVGERTFAIDDTMIDNVQDYVKLVREYAASGTLLVEQKVPIGHLTGEAGATGTSDAVIVRGNELVVVDLKYGMGVKVDAANNPQLQMYALGALEEFELLGDFEYVTMVIHQPRLNHVSEWSVPVSVLREFADEVRERSGHVQLAQSLEFGSDPDLLAGFLSPGEKQCKFCKAKATCPALRAEVGGIVHEAASLDDFADLVPLKPDSTTGDNYLSIAMAKVGLVEEWCKATRAEVERRLLAGQEVKDFKLVQGKRGNRKWADETAVENLFKSFRLRQDEAYDLSIISPTKAEKLFKSNPKRWAKVQEHITQSEGKPSVASVADPRPALDVQPVADDFRNILTTEN